MTNTDPDRDEVSRAPASSPPRRVFVVGGTGYIGKYAVRELLGRGHEVVCLARDHAGVGAREGRDETRRSLRGARVVFGNVTDGEWMKDEALGVGQFDAVLSCLGSRTGAKDDAWAVEHRANMRVLEWSLGARVPHFILLSAICVQKPRLEFQRAKLSFEKALIASGITYSIVRPTAFFKSLAGQVASVKRGGRFMVLGGGELTSCKPISESDLAHFLAECLEDPKKQNSILPIGGPGPAITPKQQGAMLSELCGRKPRYRSIPIAFFDAIIGVLSVLGAIFPKMRAKAELARIGRYYATESMLVLDESNGSYDAAKTPSYGHDTLRDFYERVLREGLGGQELGDHAFIHRETTGHEHKKPA